MDTKDEKKLNTLISKENPFRVPDGYFDSFATRVMESLPERPVTTETVRPTQTTRHFALRPWMAVAATALVAIFSISLYFMKGEQNAQESVQQAYAVSDSYMDEAADYVMLDNHEIYAYLSEN